MPRSYCRVVPLFLAMLFTVSPAVAIEWLKDLDEAKRVAVQEKKDLLVNFTGIGWCGTCAELKHEVFDKPEFAAASEHFVLVELNYPSSDDKLPEAIREKYLAWKRQYDPPGFPTVFLTDATGKPYAMTSYLEIGPAMYVGHLHLFRTCRDQCNAAMKKAAKAKGSERARYLDQALSSLRLPYRLAKKEEYGIRLVSSFYRPRIDEIISLDKDNALGLRQKYQEDVLAARGNRSRIKAIYARMDAIEKKQGKDAAIRFVDEQIEKEKSVDVRNRLRRSRLVLLEWSDRHEEALAYARQLAADESYSIEQRRRLRTRIAFNLARLKRIDEAVAVYDELIAEPSVSRRALYGYHRDKAGLFKRSGRLDEAIKSFEAARECVEEGSDRWTDAELLRAETLVEAGRLDEAKKAFEAYLADHAATDMERAGILSMWAIQLLLAGHHEDGLTKVREAEKIIANENLESTEPDFVKTVRKRMKLAEKMGSAKHKGRSQ